MCRCFIVVFTDAGIDPTLPLATMCGSGMSSCSLLLAAYQCGNTSAAVYHVRLTTVDMTSVLKLITDINQYRAYNHTGSYG